MKILIIKHSNLGENMKLFALAEAITQQYGGEILELEISSKPGRYTRWFISQLCHIKAIKHILKTNAGEKFILDKVLGVKNKSEKLEADIVITSLGYNIAVNVLVSIILNAKAIHIGPLARRWKKYFNMNVVFPTNMKTKHEYTHVIDILPTRIRLKKDSFKKKTDFVITTLIGGDTNANKYLYDTGDWNLLGDTIINIDKKGNYQWLVSTSPRTGSEAEKILQRHLNNLKNSEHNNGILYYSEEAKDVVAEFLNQSRIAIVTEDSKSMLCDALASGLKVIAVRPSSAVPKEKHLEHVKYLENKKHLARYTIEEMRDIKNIDVALSTIQPIKECWSEGFLKSFKNNVMKEE